LVEWIEKSDKTRTRCDRGDRYVRGRDRREVNVEERKKGMKKQQQLENPSR
jgi:hypothetical protein